MREPGKTGSGPNLEIEGGEAIGKLNPTMDISLKNQWEVVENARTKDRRKRGGFYITEPRYFDRGQLQRN